MQTKNAVLIGQILIEEGVITQEQLEAVLFEQEKTGNFLCETLVKMGFASEERVFDILSHALNVPYVNLNAHPIAPAVIQRVRVRFATHYNIMPVDFREGMLFVAMEDPCAVRELDDLNLVLGVEVRGVLAPLASIQKAIGKYYGVGADTLERIAGQEAVQGPPRQEIEKVEDLEALGQDASIIRFVNQILSEAIKERASDIHLEPFQDELSTRFRIDGVLYEVNIPDTIKFFQAAIVSRIKIMARLNIAERRLPQDGRIKIKEEDKELDLRVSVIPTVFGESVQIRILSSRSFLELEKLGLSAEDLSIIGNLIRKPHGIIFVTGPTGSGKSTSLYACLARLNSKSVKIITIEDPVEYQMKGVSQIQVLPQINYTFAVALRHMLRHDPDIMMVGEVRDYDTAEIAIRSALTGHLIFSTLHTNDAAGAVTRLLDMGIEPFLVSSSLQCILAQRLVRVICPYCKTAVPQKTKEEIVRRVKDASFDLNGFELYEGKGCKECRFTGYRGRTGIYEILVITGDIRDMILSRASSQRIKQKAVSEGMRTLFQDGLRKMVNGITTFTEVIRVTQE